MKTIKELEVENERLRDLNARLANQLVGMSDRLQESAKQIAADAWDAGAIYGWDQSGEGWNSEYPGDPVGLSNNPHRKAAK